MLDSDKDGGHVLSMGEETVIYLTLNITNLEEAAYLTKVYIEKPETLEYQGTETLNATNPVGFTRLLLSSLVQSMPVLLGKR